VGWQEKHIGDVLTLEYGKPLPPSSRDAKGKYAVYGANGIKDRSNSFYVDKPSIIVGRKGSAGEITLTEDKFWPLDVTYYVTFDDTKYDLQFLYHLLSQQELTKLAKGIKPGINRNDVYAKTVRVPPLSEQQRIVATLNEAFTRLATAIANAEKNLKNARELREASTDAAIAGNLTKAWRDSHSGIESASLRLDNALAQRRRDWQGTGSYKKPDAPVATKPVELPNGWVLASPEQLSTHIVDCPHKTPQWTKSGELCLRTTNFRPGFLDLEFVRFVSQATYDDRIMRLEPLPGDVVYSREGGILGIACLIPAGLKACLGQRMMLFRMDTSIVLPEYFVGVLNSKLILSEVKRLVGGAASPHLNIRDIRRFPIPLPPIAEQREIVRRLEAISADTRRLETLYEHKLAELASVKKSLFQMAFSGALTSLLSRAPKEAAE
jgi:type I restriction enzyme, S subunit